MLFIVLIMLGISAIAFNLISSATTPTVNAEIAETVVMTKITVTTPTLITTEPETTVQTTETKTEPPAWKSTRKYTAKNGDTLFALAEKTNGKNIADTLDDIRMLNDDITGNAIYAGNIYYLPIY
jgi:hypothetical protein